MALPNPSMSFSPFAILTAEEMNDLVENIEFIYDLVNSPSETALSTSNAGSFTVTADVYSVFGGKFVGGYIQAAGSFNTTEQKVGTITLPGSTSNVLFRGAADSSSSRISAAYINSAGEIYIQGPESFSGSAWFTFFGAM